MTKHTAPSPRTRVRRLPDRAHYDPNTLHAIIDEAWICTVSLSDGQSPRAIPTAHWRDGHFLYIHGAKASSMIKLLETCEACVTITHIDALVFARSAFHHSMNYRSAVIYGRFESVTGDAKIEALERFIDKLAPGRWPELRPANAKEINATAVLRIALDEASAKIRNWGVKDDEEDMAWPVWAGIVPLQSSIGSPQTDAQSVTTTIPSNIPGER